MANDDDFLDNIGTILVAAGVGTIGTNGNIFKTTKARIPTGAGPYLTLIETGGSGPEGTHNDDDRPAFVKPNLQMVARGQSYVAAKAMVQAAYSALYTFGRKSQFVQGVWFRSMAPLQEPFDTGVDGQGRATVTVNFAVVKASNAEPKPVNLGTWVGGGWIGGK